VRKYRSLLEGKWCARIVWAAFLILLVEAGVAGKAYIKLKGELGQRGQNSVATVSQITGDRKGAE